MLLFFFLISMKDVSTFFKNKTSLKVNTSRNYQKKKKNPHLFHFLQVEAVYMVEIYV